MVSIKSNCKSRTNGAQTNLRPAILWSFFRSQSAAAIKYPNQKIKVAAGSAGWLIVFPASKDLPTPADGVFLEDLIL
jgi:hypothetical protein